MKGRDNQLGLKISNYKYLPRYRSVYRPVYIARNRSVYRPVYRPVFNSRNTIRARYRCPKCKAGFLWLNDFLGHLKSKHRGTQPLGLPKMR